MVFDKTRTYSLTHTWFIKIHTLIFIYPTNHSESLMRRKHEVNIIWIDSTIHILHIHRIPGALNCLEHTYSMRSKEKIKIAWEHKSRLKKLICLYCSIHLSMKNKLSLRICISLNYQNVPFEMVHKYSSIL